MNVDNYDIHSHSKRVIKGIYGRYSYNKTDNSRGVTSWRPKKLVESGDLYRFGRGVYIRGDTWEDDFYLLQNKYGRGIFSHDTALYLLGYSDRAPVKYVMTFPKGYNAPSLKQENVVIKRVVHENYSLVIVTLSSPCGNPIHVYNLERTLCDILRGKGSDIQVIALAMKRYAVAPEKDIPEVSHL